MDVEELEEAFWWRWRRDVEGTSAAIGAALSGDAAQSMNQRFYLADHRHEALEEE